ncbi:hypothetical protein PM082_001530 [Marasmius tenuissimus]|nr:hypothetical protein PM082_001530 [Marasmius tenuissimus]
MPSLSASDPWGALHVNLLPLFNGEPLRVPIEDLNQYVKQHISAVVSASPSRSVATLEQDTVELLAKGMVTLNAKLNGVEDDKLIGRVVDRWGFFWDQVLTYAEGVLLPLQNDPLLSSLYRTPKRPSSPRRQGSGKNSISGLSNAISVAPSIDVRTLALRSFRDKIVLPLSGRLYTRLAIWIKQEESPEFPGRLYQMLLVLNAQARARPPAFSLTAPPPQLSPGETAVNDLLRIVRSTRSKSKLGMGLSSKNPRLSVSAASTRAPSFLSGGVPRDRRGRIAMKRDKERDERDKDRDRDKERDNEGEKDRFAASIGLTRSPSTRDDVTPRNTTNAPGGAAAGSRLSDIERERFLDSLRSPDIEATTRVAQEGMGLGPRRSEDVPRNVLEDEEDYTDWDQAQKAVEKLIGLEQGVVAQQQGAAGRRRMT